MQRLLQFTLDLFGTEIPAPLPGKPRKVGKIQPNRTPAPATPAQAAPEKRAPLRTEDLLPAQTLRQVLAPATYRHPAATREALLGDTVVAYQFRRGKRRTIGFTVGADGLVVSAPKWVPLYEIDKAVLEKTGWIVSKLHETRARHDRLEAARIEWRDGATLPFLGEPVTVLIDARHTFAGIGGELRVTDADGSPAAPGKSLHIGLAHDATAEQIRDSVQAWLMRQAKRVFTERLNHFAPHLGVQWRKLSLSSAGTRWGSASADGAIRLNWRLIHFKPSVIDYVVVHELSHLRVMDHSPRFWDTVRTVVPDYAELRSQLKDEAVPRW
ncbi:M48 family metallopeptidase [Polaromonas sp.]|uniref:M48 family metallopeptidase n=1 Tax=Polaromonas sp. TaxID=1869339 RepID=UPI00356657C7